MRVAADAVAAAGFHEEKLLSATVIETRDICGEICVLPRSFRLPGTMLGNYGNNGRKTMDNVMCVMFSL